MSNVCSHCGYPRTRTACANCLYIEPEDRALQYERALKRIAAGRRQDGTYNLGREACEQIARKALGDCSYEGEAYETFQDFLDNEGGHL